MMPLALMGGFVLSRFARSAFPVPTLLIAAAVVSVNIALFFLSPLHMGRDASIAWIHLVDSETRNALDTLHETPEGLPAVVILHDALVTLRQIAYYFPLVPVYGLAKTLATDCYGNQDPVLHLPRKAVRVLSVSSFRSRDTLGPPFQAVHGLLAANLPPGARFHFAGCEFRN